ncbi:MAG: C-GCAxxG-C-C family protein [Muribaculaceae bacterium]|nr:C-GCAxxG-C-C family protein [Muribaculaceae bacterium]
MKLTKEQRLNRASDARAQGYNCAQAVMMAFPDVFTLPSEVTLRLGTALGGGMGMTGGICGALSALALAEGMRTEGEPADKVKAYKSFHALNDAFREQHGSTLCPELKASGVSCEELIKSGILMYDRYINEEAL